jgi:hypothetical protein
MPQHRWKKAKPEKAKQMIPMLLNTDWGMYQKGNKSEEFNR